MLGLPYYLEHHGIAAMTHAPSLQSIRRIARARVMTTKYGQNATTKFIDSSPNLQLPAHAVCVATTTGLEMTASTIRTTRSESAEEVPSRND